MSIADGADGGLQERLVQTLHRYRHLLALGSFALGLASFLLVQRREHAAQMLVIVLPLAWLLILAENWLGETARARLHIRLPPALLRYAVQLTHQQSFFFTLPFFFYTTTWRSGQALFTGLVALAGLATLIDPLYYRVIAPRRALYLALHALAVFVATLAAAPMLWQLTTAQSLRLAAVVTAVFAVPSFAVGLGPQRPMQKSLLVLLAVAMGFGAWLARAWIPPATLWVSHGVITRAVDAATRTPADALNTLTADEARGGVCAWTPIRAPRGLSEGIRHVWIQNGSTLDSIPLAISGGREEGYRAWSCKRNLPADPRGDWQVRSLTGDGQLIGVLRFAVR